jgi:hypothetical protein
VPARELAEDVKRVRKEMAKYDHHNIFIQTSQRNEVVYRVRNADVLAKLEKIRRSK